MLFNTSFTVFDFLLVEKNMKNTHVQLKVRGTAWVDGANHFCEIR